MKFEAAGRPVVVIVSERFEAMARRAAKGFGLPGARLVVVQHPIGGEPDSMLRTMARGAVEEAMNCFTGLRCEA